MNDYSLYVVTDRTLMRTATMEETVEAAIAGGATMIQLREKELDSRSFFEEAVRIQDSCSRHGIPLIVNDRIDIAMAVGSAGIHVGQQDLPVDVVRRIVGKAVLLGVSVATVDQALRAWCDGADYLGVGAMFPTPTKEDAERVSFSVLSEILERVPLPVVTIGGMSARTIPSCAALGIDGVAVVSAVIGSSDVTEAARSLKALFLRYRESRTTSCG